MQKYCRKKPSIAWIRNNSKIQMQAKIQKGRERIKK